MRRVIRVPLKASVEKKLKQRQITADRKHQDGKLKVVEEWKRARQTNPLKSVLDTLRSMMGKRERCMYCLDSHGTDIEHFWPKTPYPERMFVWPNLLLCCTECGRLKGDRFPVKGNQPLLIDPTVEEPWLHLDFDPDTGNVVARFDAKAKARSPKGITTVEVLNLDRREALATGYRITFRRLSALVMHDLQKGNIDAASLMSALREADDHGLLSWCFLGTGQNISPFRELHNQQPKVWTECVADVQIS